MTEAEKAKFIAAVAGIAGFYGTELNKMALKIYWDALREFEVDPVLEAIRSHIKDPENGRFMPKPADIIRNLPADPNRQVVGADAAWEMALRLGIGDEDATVIAPKAILWVFPHTLWEIGDKIAARMAFKEAWPYALEAYGMGYGVSLGNNPAGREPAIMEALKNNLITNETALSLLPHMAEEIAALAPPENAPLIGGPS